VGEKRCDYELGRCCPEYLSSGGRVERRKMERYISLVLDLTNIVLGKVSDSGKFVLAAIPGMCGAGGTTWTSTRIK
jgi:hypothetical protein